ncbi:MAG: amidohydrolase family protein [Terriglobia bacterium]
MILDIHAYVGKWPYWPVSVSTASQLLEVLDKAQIDRAAVCSTRSLFVNWEDGNQEAERAVREHSPRMIAFACLGPLELSHTVGQGDFDFAGFAARGFRGFRLYPQHHTYHPLHEPFVDRIAEEAAVRGWPILLPLRVLMNWGVPSLDLACMVALVERHPRAPWILAGINYFHELRAAVSLLRRHPSVYLETSCVQGFDAIRKLVEECGSQQLLFGSAAPLQHAGAALEKIIRSRISDSDREAILGANASRLLRLDQKTWPASSKCDY